MKIAREVIAFMATLLNRAEAYYFAAMTTAGPTCTGPDSISACSTGPTGADGTSIVPTATIACGDSVNGDTRGGPIVGNNGLGTCGTSNGNVGFWYLFEDTATTFCSVTFDTCSNPDLDTVIQVWDDAGCTGSNPACVDGNNDDCSLQSRITINGNPTRRYYVWVGGLAVSTGTFTLDVTCTAE